MGGTAAAATVHGAATATGAAICGGAAYLFTSDSKNDDCNCNEEQQEDSTDEKDKQGP